jgi:hypothetical protein
VTRAPRVFLVAALLPTAFASAARGAEPESDASPAEEAAREATTPFPVKQQLKVKSIYSFPRGSTREKAELQFEALLPFAGALVPELEVDHVASLARVQITGANLESAKGTVGGLEDLTFVDLAVRRFGVLEVGAGFGSVFPLATSPELGDGKWLLGPAAGVRLDVVEALRLAVLAQALWSVAGSGEVPTVAYSSVQPFFALHLPGALSVSTDATMKFFWAGGTTRVPVNLGFGHGFGKHFVGTLKGEVTVAGSDAVRGALKGEIDFNFQP